MGQVIHHLSRIKSIQRVLIQQIDIIETMTPLDFMEFRDLLVPASGFQSLQFKQIEIQLGIKRKHRINADKEFFLSRLSLGDLKILEDLESQKSLLELTDTWLGRMPFLEFHEFHFWKAYDHAVNKMLDSDAEIIRGNPTLSDREKEFQLTGLEMSRTQFESLLDRDKFESLREKGEFRLSHNGFLAALFQCR